MFPRRHCLKALQKQNDLPKVALQNRSRMKLSSERSEKFRARREHWSMRCQEYHLAKLPQTNCVGEKHIDETCHHLAKQSCTCRWHQGDRDVSTKIGLPVEYLMDWWSEATSCWSNDRWCVQSKLHQKVSSHPIPSSRACEINCWSSLGSHLWTRRASVGLRVTQRQNPWFQRQRCLHEFPKLREAVAIPRRFYIRRATELQMYGYTCG